MIAIHIDSERKYLKVTAAARANGDEFELVRSRDGVLNSANKYWCTDKTLAKDYKKLGIEPYDPGVSDVAESVDADSGEVKESGSDSKA